jgi:hypothetical protein
MFFFAHEEELRLLSMHPESLCCDTTFGTENTKKELFDVAGVDGNNKGFNGCRAYIPNAQQWVFWYTFKHCLPMFWGKVDSHRVRPLITDGCPQEINSVVSNIGNGRSFPNAVHSLCYFHLAIIGWCKHVTMPSVSDSSSLSDVAINTVRDWTKSWFFDVETKEEYVHSTGELLDFLDMSCENQVLPFYMAESIKTWLVGTLQKCESLWNNHECLYVESMNMRTTSVAESLHWSMKSGYDGVRSANRTKRSAEKMMDKAERKAKDIAMHNAGQIICKQQWNSMPTANQLTDYCQSLADLQWSLAESEQK